MAETSDNPQVVALKQRADGMSREELQEKLRALSSKPFKAQATWFMNALWDCPPQNLSENPEECEKIYNIMKKCVELSSEGEEGTSLDEFSAHRLLESFGDTMSVTQMRTALGSMDIDQNRQVSLTEYLIHRYSVDWPYLVVAQLAAVSPKLALAQRKLEEAKGALAQAKDAEDLARTELQASEEAEAQAVEERTLSERAVAETQAARSRVQEAEAQQETAVADLEAKVKTKTERLAVLEAKSEDASLSVVKRNKAKAELAQAKSDDDQPLRTAKIQQEASLRRVRKAVRHAGETEVATAAAKKRADEAVDRASRVHSRASRAAVEAQTKTEQAEGVFKETGVALEEAVKENTGGEGGTIWILDYELEDAKKRMPRHRVQQMAAEAAQIRAQLTGQA